MDDQKNSTDINLGSSQVCNILGISPSYLRSLVKYYGKNLTYDANKDRQRIFHKNDILLLILCNKLRLEGIPTNQIDVKLDEYAKALGSLNYEVLEDRSDKYKIRIIELENRIKMLNERLYYLTEIVLDEIKIMTSEINKLKSEIGLKID